MQEIAIILSSLAGVATAAAVRARSAGMIPRIGASPRIKGQIGALHAEREILTKTISRLHQDSELPAVQRDRLLARYQHQLGTVLAKSERLEEASRHPDLGPVGDGLITLMDQRLSGLDERLHDISARIAAGTQETIKIPEPEKEAPKRPAKKIPAPVEVPAGPREPFEITTLTSVSGARDPGPVAETQEKREIKVPETIPEIIPQAVPEATPKTIPEIIPRAVPQTAPEPKAAQPSGPATSQETELDGDGELDEIKKSITTVLSKLDQAEVE